MSRRRSTAGIPRYCGRVKVVIRPVWVESSRRGNIFLPARYDYRCAVYVDGERVGFWYVRIPLAPLVAADSPESYDDVAQSAISHALSDGAVSELDCELYDGRLRIRRVRPS